MRWGKLGSFLRNLDASDEKSNEKWAISAGFEIGMDCPVTPVFAKALGRLSGKYRPMHRLARLPAKRAMA